MAEEEARNFEYLLKLFQEQLDSTSPEQRPVKYEPNQLHDFINVQNEVGEGTYGRVYKSRINNRDVAIKIMKPCGTSGSGRVRLGFLLERCALMVNNENIVHFVGYCEDPQLYAILMEYLPTSVDRVMKSFLFVDVINVLGATARGLLAIHGYNPMILHRDIKPSNILYQSKNTQKLIDFGSAKIGEVETPAFGTKGYKDTVAGTGGNEACDVYSWSKLALAVLTKSDKTFKGGTRNVLDKLKKKMSVLIKTMILVKKSVSLDSPKILESRYLNFFSNVNPRSLVNDPKSLRLFNS